ncbi:hypothetical protein [Enterococcus gilvus]|uniref:Transposase n=1 Tax=Enterococcus gilvus ATCC BAA-350 TaxID=1158614 RepID=R2XWD5_9ENTE|nr:hypothetical protein [Enterococcus gilvus]EOI58853.1 hypothetical protein UKC_00038 [Enterococcus gilvus ATCC BAA-350]EOW79270.1 hypothetical protein I592_03409 [Enterococcus gilvus ATCC BAA-350]OJG40528.1 hypothetical protein RV02_GL002029 [Enterococcus gilvus]
MAKGKYQEWITEDGLLVLEGWARDGLTDEQLAHNIGIAAGTLYDWKNKYPEISEALKKGKEVVDVQVENALLKRALGYHYTEDEYLVVEMDDEEYWQSLDLHIKVFKIENPEATDLEIEKERLSFSRFKKILVKQKTKEVAPDTTAQIFWLKNRKPIEWRDKQVIQHDGEVKINNPYAGLTTDELRRLAYGDDG